MEKRVLVTYASKYGSSGELLMLLERKCAAKVCRRRVLIRMLVTQFISGSRHRQREYTWASGMPEQIDFGEGRNRDVLRQSGLVAYFSCLYDLARPTEKNRPKCCPTWNPVR